MTLIGFDSWAGGRLTDNVHPLSILKDSVLGVDGGHFLQQALKESEPLLPATGSMPFTVHQQLETFLETCRDTNITPIFVFSGASMKPIEKDKPLSKLDTGASARTRAWELYEKGEGKAAVEEFGKASSSNPKSLFRYAIRILHKAGAQFIVSPYSASAQLAYMERHQKQLVDCIYGSTELLLYDVDKIVTSINKQQKTFTWISKKALLRELNLDNEAFLDAVVLAGTSDINPLPTLKPDATFKHAIDVLGNYRTGINAVKTLTNVNANMRDSGYHDKFLRARNAIRHHIIFTDDGETCTLPNNAHLAPADIHVVMGERLPDELFFYLSKGLIGPEVIEMIHNEKLLALPPLEGGDSEEYKRFLDSLVPLRTVCIGLIMPRLNRWVLGRKVEVVYWWDRETPRLLDHRALQPVPYEQSNNWNVSENILRPALEKLGYSSPCFSFALKSISDESFAKETVTPRGDALLKTKDEILANTFWRMLQLRSFIHDGGKNKHTLTPWGVALNVALQTLKPEDRHLETAVYTGIELIRLKALKAEPLSLLLSGAPQMDTDAETRHATLIARVGCLVSQRHDSTGYAGPLSRNLLAFHCIVSTMTHDLRNLVEMVLTSILLYGDAEREDRNDWAELASSIPFLEDAGVGVAAAIMFYLASFKTNPRPSAEEKERNREKIDDMYSNSPDIVHDMEQAYKVWDALIAGLKTENLTPETLRFMDADKWLANFR